MKIHVFKNTTKKWELSFVSPTKYYNCMEEYCILNILYIFCLSCAFCAFLAPLNFPQMHRNPHSSDNY